MHGDVNIGDLVTVFKDVTTHVLVLREGDVWTGPMSVVTLKRGEPLVVVDTVVVIAGPYYEDSDGGTLRMVLMSQHGYVYCLKHWLGVF